MSKTLDTVRTYFASRKALRQERAMLERELAAYNTPSARLDLEAILARHSSDDTQEIEAILRRQAVDQLTRTTS